MYNDLGNNGRIRYDKIVSVLRPGQSPADVELTIDEHMIVVSSLRAYLKDGNLDPYWDLLLEINRNTRATWKCTSMRMPALADTPANGGECMPTIDTSADTTPAESAPLTSDPAVPPSADNLSPEEQKCQECKKRLDKWYKEGGNRKISDWMDKTGRNPCKHIDYFAMTGNIELLDCAHSAGWVMSTDIAGRIAKSGDTAVFEWICKNMTIDWMTCVIAAITAGHLPVLKIIRAYCLRRSIAWGEYLVPLYTAAASAGHVDIINWLWISGYPIRVEDMDEIVSNQGNAAVIAWCNDMLH